MRRLATAQLTKNIMPHIPVDKSLTDFVFQTLMSCGSNEIVLNAAAPNPIMAIISMCFSLSPSSPQYEMIVYLFFDLYLEFA